MFTGLVTSNSTDRFDSDDSVDMTGVSSVDLLQPPCNPPVTPLSPMYASYAPPLTANSTSRGGEEYVSSQSHTEIAT